MRWKKKVDKKTGQITLGSDLCTVDGTPLFRIIQLKPQTFELRILFVHDWIDKRPGTIFEGTFALTNAKYAANTFCEHANRAFRDTSG